MLKSIPGFCLLISSPTFACTASENFDIYFPINSATVPNAEIVRLANWAIDQKISYANHTTKEEILVSGHAEESEQHPQQLAQSRLESGRTLLEQLHFLRGTVKASARVYSHRDVDNGRRVEISFEPDCPNKCCTGR
ncbi:hypothetical protein [Burkholderia stagnalis]|uniref:OmpA-like domain-containing protein n=1 Tax=Burkholderia stagnalis TaxID=1503054 RepID=A0ABX9YV43_9BURK|nr:hypothetical protein [Burkholderia stagnalis]RQQ62984.1 hypothetical protein DF158_08125 [Burkholderia stagnalis]RQQ72667.1 hypothetical protein DF137_06440 [Burkholderia stagnalis]RQQ74953.1 hypothetical protein DF139_03435 [Burkholderia stagnalis]RQQ86414.1 hypothetical protein DF138_03170 [Burkholderia stagnalis]RQQ93989.1 hypothetical protein DF134_08540 [Burkholderia stagnalis]